MILSREQFDVIYNNLKIDDSLNRDFVYDCFVFAFESADKLSNDAFQKAVPINPVVLLLYIVHEYRYFIRTNNKDIELNDNLKGLIVSYSLDKYFTNEHLNFKNYRHISKYDPRISTLMTYVNFALSVLSNVKKGKPSETLLIDVLYKSFSMTKAIIELVEEGFYTEAFSTWRTLHESECILLILAKYGKGVKEAYLKHMRYTMAFRNLIPSKEETDAIFVQIKDEMHNIDLKSKDMKKYIEYGWLMSIDEFKNDENRKFNFRDGVEKIAGLEKYSKVYEMASEIAHSSPMLIYSSELFFYNLVMTTLYESFFRIETIFAKLYVRNVPNQEAQRFLAMQKQYLTNLKIIYTNERGKRDARNKKPDKDL